MLFQVTKKNLMDIVKKLIHQTEKCDSSGTLLNKTHVSMRFLVVFMLRSSEDMNWESGFQTSNFSTSWFSVICIRFDM